MYIVKNGYRILQPNDDKLYKLYEMMRQCWNLFPEERPTFEFLHGYLADYFEASEPIHMEVDAYSSMCSSSPR